jgi:uncharacterized protein YehS (DUF1456 family)
MNSAEFLNGLFTKVGVENDNPALKELVTKLAAVDISDDLVSKFNNSYMTEAAAKANTKIIGHFRAQHFNGLDDEIKPLYDELEIPDDVKAELFKETSSTKRAAMLLRKVKELENKKVGSSKGDKLELENQIKQLNGQIKTEKENAQAEIAKAKTEFDEQLKDVYLTQNLAGHKYASDHAKEEDFLLPKTKIAKALKEKNLKAVLDGKEFKLQTEQGVAYFENNNEVSFKTFTEKVLADNKLTTVTDTTAQTQTTIAIPSKVGALNNSKFMARVEELETKQQNP